MEIQGAARYLQLTTEHYIQLVKPPHTYPAILPNTTTHIVRLCTAKNNILKQDWAIVSGFRWVIVDNYREAVYKRYYNKLFQPIFRYKNIVDKTYILLYIREDKGSNNA